jgi:hypothetical protein
MTLHLLKEPLSPTTLEWVHSAERSAPSIAVLLPGIGEAPALPGIATYRLAESDAGSRTGAGDVLSYEGLVDLIFSADKVIAW